MDKKPVIPRQIVQEPVNKPVVKNKPKSAETVKTEVKPSMFANHKQSEKSSNKKEVSQVKVEENSQPEEVNVEKPKEKPAISTSNSKPKESSNKKNTGNQSDRLKNMFAAAASKPRKPVPEKAPIVVKSESEDEDFVSKKSKPSSSVKKPAPKTYSRRNSNASKSKASEVKPEPTRKRKRIVDILSSSEEDEEDSRPTQRVKSVSSDEEGKILNYALPHAQVLTFCLQCV